MATKKPSKAASLNDDRIPLLYVGQKPQEVDLIAGTGLTWLAGETHTVTRAQAAILLQHPGVWADARENALDDPIKPGVTPQPVDLNPEPEIPPPMLDLAVMDEAGLRAMAMREYGREFPAEMDTETVRAEIQQIVVGQRYN